VADGQFWGEPSGVIRAYDAESGKFVWAFDVGRPDDHGEPPPGKTYTLSTPNSWGPMSADEELGMVYVPTGNVGGSDYFGAQRRPFDDKFSSSTMALDAETGQLRWSFQYIHHDLWDYDVASQPTLVDLPGPNGVQKALIQPTKRGEIYVLDRVTGRPIRQVRERPVPTGGHVPEERIAPTQPYSIEMPRLTGPRLTEAMMWGLTPLDQLWCRIRFRQFRYEGTFTPPGKDWNMLYPGAGGGMNWAGATVDPDRKLLIVNSLRIANTSRLIPRKEADDMGVAIKGSKAPNGGKRPSPLGVSAQAGTPYAAAFGPFFSPLAVPCQQPPYGTISAIDLTSGKLVWTHPLGSAREAGPFGWNMGLPLPMGMPVKGGVLATRSGVTIVAATKDATIRAFESATGQELWEDRLPAAAHATPMTYLSARSGKQFVVVAAGGDPRLQSRRGDYVIAYSLP